MNGKKAKYFDIHPYGKTEYALHMEFSNFNIKSFIVKIKKEKFAQKSFSYKVKQRDYIKEYKMMLQELGDITTAAKQKIKQKYDRQIKQIKKGIVLTFKQH